MSREKEILKFKPDKRRLCDECKGEMHWCSADRQSGRSEQGLLYKGCAARGKRHPGDGDWFICLFCDVKVQA